MQRHDRIGPGSTQTSRRNGRDRVLCIDRQVSSHSGGSVFPDRDFCRNCRRLLEALFRKRTYAQDAISAVSGRTLRQAGVGRGRVGPMGKTRLTPQDRSEAPLGGLGSRLGECRFTLDKLVRAIRRIRPSRQTHSYLKFLHKDAKISDRRASSRIATRTASS